MKDEGLEYLLSILPPGPDKSCALHLLPRALDFVRARGGEFGTAQMQKRHTASGGDFKKPVYVIEKIRVGNGWKIIGKEEIKGYEEKAKD